MILNGLVIENFGLFKGIHKIDFTPEANKPIILFGGKNATGKTTLFEAVQLCLYGPYCNGLRMSNAQYEDYLRKKIHKPLNGEKLSQSRVELKFQHARMGILDSYTVSRKWGINGSKIKEDLRLLRNGILISDIEAEHWQDFLTELIPPEFTRLFFFDGEKIQSLAEEKSSPNFLKESFKLLHGLDLVEKLQSDLKIYHRNQLSGELKEDMLRKELDRLKKLKKEIENKLEIELQNKAQIQSKIDNVQSNIEAQNRRLKNEGGNYAERREEAINKKASIEADLEHTNIILQKLCSGLLPFLLVPKFLETLRKRLIAENEYIQLDAAASIFSKIKNDFVQKMAEDKFWTKFNLPNSDLRNDLAKEIIKQLEKSKKTQIKKKSIKLIHQLSNKDFSKVMGWIEKINTRIPQQFFSLIRKTERLVADQRKIQGYIDRAPDEELIAPIVQELNELTEELGKLKNQAANLEEKIKGHQFALSETERKEKKMEEDKEKLKKLKSRLVLIEKADNVLSKFARDLIERKISTFEENLLFTHSNLAPSGTPVECVNVDHSDFLIHFIDKNGDEILKSMFSAGEKQIYAINVLWALTRTSGRQIPLIIDTPMGRLDSDNRKAIVERFLPRVAPQILIFSTDTEVDKTVFELMKSLITKSYELTKNTEEGFVEIRSGYFNFKN